MLRRCSKRITRQPAG